VTAEYVRPVLVNSLEEFAAAFGLVVRREDPDDDTRGSASSSGTTAAMSAGTRCGPAAMARAMGRHTTSSASRSSR
jgi:hypothetical protein